jgi:hypothetical protein
VTWFELRTSRSRQRGNTRDALSGVVRYEPALNAPRLIEEDYRQSISQSELAWVLSLIDGHHKITPLGERALCHLGRTRSDRDIARLLRPRDRLELE